MSATSVKDFRICQDPADPQTGEPERLGQAVGRNEDVISSGRRTPIHTGEGVQIDLIARRWMVEQAIARFMRRGLRQARYRGTKKMQFQAVTAALALRDTGGPDQRLRRIRERR